MNKQTQLNLFDTRKTKNTMPWHCQPFLCIDVETTGLDNKEHRIIEIAWLIFHNSEILTEKSYLCNIGQPIPPIITKITGISSEMLENKPNFSACADELLTDMAKVNFFVAYNAPFDAGFITTEFDRLNKSLPQKPWIDPCVFIKEIDRYKKSKKLTSAATRWGIKLDNAHRALSDAKATGQLLCLLQNQLNCDDLDKLHKRQERWRVAQDKSYKEYLKRNNPDN